MGTSGSSKGPGSSTPLVPSWLGEPPAPPTPLLDDDPLQESPPQPGEPQLPPIPPAPPPKRFRDARRDFTKFAGSGGRDQKALRRAAGTYVRSGARGSRNATRRMGAARTTASGVLAALRSLQRDGVVATLRRLNLDELAGRPPVDIFIALTDVICRDGGSIDEGIARDAWLETVCELDSLGIDSLETLSATQVQEMFLSFISHSIEGRLFQDIGVNALKVPDDLGAIEAFEAQFRDYIRGAVRDSFTTDLADLASFTDARIREVVNRTYQEAWDLLVVWGDAAI